MPKQQRWAVKQDLDQVIVNIGKAGIKLLDLKKLYQPSHPGIASLFGACSEILYKLTEELENIKNQI